MCMSALCPQIASSAATVGHTHSKLPRPLLAVLLWQPPPQPGAGRALWSVTGRLPSTNSIPSNITHSHVTLSHITHSHVTHSHIPVQLPLILSTADISKRVAPRQHSRLLPVPPSPITPSPAPPRHISLSVATGHSAAGLAAPTGVT